jgi:hypothetical protein
MPRPVLVVRDLHSFRPRARERPRWDRFAFGLATGMLIGLTLFALGVVGAIHAEDGERFSPSSRGPRASYETDQVQQWRAAVDAYPWPTETALLVIACESQGDPGVSNRDGSGATGLFQLLGWEWLAARLYGTRDVTIPWVNIAVAYQLWRDAGGTFGWWGADGRAHGHWAASIGCWGW